MHKGQPTAMEKRVVLEKRGRAPDQIYELILDNCRSTTIEGLTDEFTNLKSLSLNSVGLTSLKGFPKLPNLQKLELSDNRISNGLNLLNTSPKLTSLNLSGNKIKDLETLEPLKEFKYLKCLDLFNNEVTSVENYREKTFKLLPRLQYLDGFDVKEQEVDDSEQEGDSVNGYDDEESDEIVEAEEEDDDEWEEQYIGLDAVYKDNLEDESEGEDYDGGDGTEEEEDDEDLEEEESAQPEADKEEDTTPRGKKRKHEGEEEVN